MAELHIEKVHEVPLNWSTDDRLGSLATVRQVVGGKLDNAIHWYRAKGRRKNLAAFGLRIFAIGLATLAAAWPTVAEMIVRTGPVTCWWARPGMVTILAVAAGALILLDRLIGASSGWIRYTMACTALKEVRDDLELGSALEMATWADGRVPNLEETRRMIALFQTLLVRGNQIIRDETVQWKAEFQSAIAQTEEVARALPRRIEEAILIVRVANPERLADTWFISVNNSPPEPAAGDSKCLRLPPGAVAIRVRATVKSGKDDAGTSSFSMETGDILAAGVSKTITVTLPQKQT